MLNKFLTQSNKATIGGYIIAIYNATMAIDVDNLNFSLPSTYLKLFGAVVMPILLGHSTEVKTKD